jgi:hypothetical protein
MDDGRIKRVTAGGGQKNRKGGKGERKGEKKGEKKGERKESRLDYSVNSWSSGLSSK